MRQKPLDGSYKYRYNWSQDQARRCVRAELMLHIRESIRRRKLTQAKAAKLFGVTQPRISDLMRGKIYLFSVDSLIAMLSHAGAKVELRVRAA